MRWDQFPSKDKYLPTRKGYSIFSGQHTHKDRSMSLSSFARKSPQPLPDFLFCDTVKLLVSSVSQIDSFWKCYYLKHRDIVSKSWNEFLNSSISGVRKLSPINPLITLSLNISRETVRTVLLGLKSMLPQEVYLKFCTLPAEDIRQ